MDPIVTLLRSFWVKMVWPKAPIPTSACGLDLSITTTSKEDYPAKQPMSNFETLCLSMNMEVQMKGEE